MADEGQQDTAPDTSDKPAETPKPTDIKPAEKTVPQTEVDRIVRERIDRERAKFADYGDLKTKAQKLDEIEAANASDLEKAVKQARAEGAAEVQSKANDILRRAEARALAAEAKFRNPALAIKAIDLSDVKVADDGAVDAGAIKTLLDALAKDEPYLIDDGKVRPKPDDAQGRTAGVQPVPESTPKGLGTLRHAYTEAAKK